MAEGSAKDRPDCRDVLIVGAGPVGLTLANVLGAHGLTVDVVDQRDALIDYPRGVGLDDESLRGFQSIGLVHRVLPHTVPNQIMRFVNRKDEVIAEMRPTDTPYGWPRRNGFVQPLVDAELLTGLKRYPTVRVRWSSEMVHLQEKVDRVTATLATSGGDVAVDARFVVGADGGRSHTRKLVGIDFHGTTSPTRWLVIDVDNDPLGMPNTYVGADPRRPYVSISIAHGIRRFELMMHADEPDELAEDDGFIADMLRRFVPRPENLDIIRRRVYTHHSRIAGSFRKGRVFLAGDAAHLMPVWQGQGYNSGIRDAVNLGWKLAAVLRGFSDSTLLDSYDSERRDHAAAMIRLSTLVGRVISPTNTRTAFMRDQGLRLVSLVPQAKRYLLEMRFKPMPRYETGAVYHDGKGDRRTSPVGRLFIQPKVDTRADTDVLLDDVLGHWFSIVCWNNNPAAVLDTAAFDLWKGVGAKFFSIRPTSQLHWGGDDHAAVEIIGDRTGQLKAWFDAHRESVLFLRPDHCVAGASIAQEASTVAMSLGQRLSFVGVPT